MKHSDFTNSVFQEDWWLDAVSPNSWKKIVIGDARNPDLVFPYVCTRKYRFNRIHMPKLTQTIGPWLKNTDAKYCKKLSREKDLFFALLEKIPDFDDFCVAFHYSFTNWLPFYWKGFRQTTRYTYVLDELTDLEKVWYGFQENIKTDIKKAQKIVSVNTEMDMDSFINIQKKTFQRQNVAFPFSKDFLVRVDQACSARSCRKFFYAIDEKYRVHAAIYVMWDDRSAYYLMGGGDPELRNSGATSLLLWEAIKFCSTVTKEFNFEGSMIESIERFFRAFGAHQKPYFLIQKEKPFFNLIKKVKGLI